MILSYERKFLFIKTMKTAGTSVEIALTPHCGPLDTVTPIGVIDELLRWSEFAVLPRGFSRSSEKEAAYRQAIVRGDADEIQRLRDELQPDSLFWNHMKARKIRKLIPAATYDGLFKFTLDRHPYEKAVSLAYFLFARGRGEQTLEQTLEAVVRNGNYRSSPYYTAPNGRMLVDLVLMTEDLPGCLKQVEERLDIRFHDPLPRAKGAFRTDRRPAREILSRAQKLTVQKHCADEFERYSHPA